MNTAKLVADVVVSINDKPSAGIGEEKKTEVSLIETTILMVCWMVSAAYPLKLT